MTVVNTMKWVSPIVITQKKYGISRLQADFKPLYETHKKEPYSLPFLNEILDAMACYEMYSVCDGFSPLF